MSGFIKAQDELKEYCKEQSVEQGKQEKLVAVAMVKVSDAKANKVKAERTMTKLNDIIG